MKQTKMTEVIKNRINVTLYINYEIMNDGRFASGYS